MINPSTPEGTQPQPTSGRPSASMPSGGPAVLGGPEFEAPPGMRQQSPGETALSAADADPAPQSAEMATDCIVPLRPLEAATLLEGALRFLRRHPRASVGLSAVIWGVAFLLTALLTAAVMIVIVRAGLWDRVVWGGDMRDPTSGPTVRAWATGAILAMLAVMAVLPMLAQALLSSMLAPTVGQAALGRQKSWKWAWRQAKPAVLSVILAQAIAHLLTAVALAAVAVPVLMLVMRDKYLALIVVLVLIPVVIFAGGIYSGYLAMLTSSIVYERKATFSGMRRAISVLRKSFWRVALVATLVVVLAGIVFSLFTAPFQITASGLTAYGEYKMRQAFTLDDSRAGYSMINRSTVWLGAGLAVNVLGAFVASIFTAPYWAAASTLQYLDHRMRFEQIDDLFGPDTLERAQVAVEDPEHREIVLNDGAVTDAAQPGA